MTDHVIHTVDVVTGPKPVQVIPFTPEEETAASTPIDYAALDQSALNAILASPGSVVRGLALIMLDIANGKIPIKTQAPFYNTAQLIDLIKVKMR